MYLCTELSNYEKQEIRNLNKMDDDVNNIYAIHKS